MHWIYLLAAIAFEIMGTVSMKLCKGFSHAVPSVLLFVFYGACLASLTMALKGIPLSVAYSLWSGIGTAAIVLIDWAYFKEVISPLKFFFLAMITVGACGLKLFTNPQ
jgi:small multidrug resistance pump